MQSFYFVFVLLLFFCLLLSWVNLNMLKKTVELSVIWEDMKPLWRHCKVIPGQGDPHIQVLPYFTPYMVRRPCMALVDIDSSREPAHIWPRKIKVFPCQMLPRNAMKFRKHFHFYGTFIYYVSTVSCSLEEWIASSNESVQSSLLGRSPQHSPMPNLPKPQTDKHFLYVRTTYRSGIEFTCQDTPFIIAHIIHDFHEHINLQWKQW